MGGPLSGVRVIDVTTAVLGPVATQILGDMGADVIKVEPPEGDPMRNLGPMRHANMAALYMTMNRNKRSLVLDLKKQVAREALLRLVQTADVFIHNMRPKAAQRLGLHYAAIAAENPKIVYAAASGFRIDGPARDKPAFDDVIQGASGIPGLYLLSGREPQYVPFAAADKITGHVLASCVGMALFYRERTGLGQEVQVPMLETMVSFNLIDHLWGAAFVPPIGKAGYTRMATPHRRPFATKDGYICVMPVTDAQWQRILIELGRPDMASDERFAKMKHRGDNFDALYGAVREGMAKRTTLEWQKALDAADIANAPAKGLDDLLVDDYLAETEFFQALDHPSEGPMMTTMIPVQFSVSPGKIRAGAPRLGEHTRAILESLGYVGADLDALAEGF